MSALSIHAGPKALAHLTSQGLRPGDIRLVPGAAGGPKGLILHHLDRQLFGEWLSDDAPDALHLVGASIGAWRMAAAAMPEVDRAFLDLAEAYILQRYDPEPPRKAPTPRQVSSRFAQSLADFFADRVGQVLSHRRRRLHVLTARGRHVLARETSPRRAFGFGGLALGNVLSRRAVGALLERTVFSTPGEPLPVRLDDLPTRHVQLDEGNFLPALQASCSIPFVLEAVHDIPGALAGAHWDGGLVDYHLHWPYAGMSDGLVLYPHFQRQVIPGWLDKGLRWRHGASPMLDNVILLAPDPAWVKTLPGGKLPDRSDFVRLGFGERVAVWRRAVAESERMAAEWVEWLAQGCPPDRVKPL